MVNNSFVVNVWSMLLQQHVRSREILEFNNIHKATLSSDVWQFFSFFLLIMDLNEIELSLPHQQK
jgi:hypothetical protein